MRSAAPRRWRRQGSYGQSTPQLLQIFYIYMRPLCRQRTLGTLTFVVFGPLTSARHSFALSAFSSARLLPRREATPPSCCSHARPALARQSLTSSAFWLNLALNWSRGTGCAVPPCRADACDLPSLRRLPDTCYVHTFGPQLGFTALQWAESCGHKEAAALLRAAADKARAPPAPPRSQPTTTLRCGEKEPSGLVHPRLQSAVSMSWLPV